MSDKPAQYRILQYILSFAGVGVFIVAYQGLRGGVAPAMGITLVVLGMACFFAAARSGWVGARIRIQEQERKADAVALITLAAFLKEKSEEELELAIKKGGPAGQAARMVLDRRRNGLTRPSGSHPASS